MEGKARKGKPSFLKERSKKFYPLESGEAPVTLQHTGFWALRALVNKFREAPGKNFLLLFFKKEDFALRFLRFSDLPRCRRRGWSAFADHDWDRGDFGLSGAQSIF